MVQASLKSEAKHSQPHLAGLVGGRPRGVGVDCMTWFRQRRGSGSLSNTMAMGTMATYAVSGIHGLFALTHLAVRACL